MGRKIMLIIILLFFGTGIGFLWGISSGVELSGHDHSNHDLTDTTDIATHDHSQHDHNLLMEVASGSGAPSLNITLHPDSASGWNLEINSHNFRFTPEAVNLEHVDGQGHAHLYVNGEKLARIYSNWTHIPSLPSGKTEVMVTLNSNTHSPLSIDGKSISAKIMVDVK